MRDSQLRLPGCGRGARADRGAPASYDLAVRAEQNLRLVNKEADLELSGELRLVSTPAGQDVSGELSTLRAATSSSAIASTSCRRAGLQQRGGHQPKIDILAEPGHRDDKIQIHITNTFAEPRSR